MPVLHRAPQLEPRHEIFRVERILRPEADGMSKRRNKIIAVLPAFNAEQTLAATLADIPPGSIDEIILVDDGSRDRTGQAGPGMGLTVVENPAQRALRSPTE